MNHDIWDHVIFFFFYNILLLSFVFTRRGCCVGLATFHYYRFFIYLTVMIICKLYWLYCLPAKDYGQQFMKPLLQRLKPMQTFWIHQGQALVRVPELEQVIYTSLKVNWKATSCQNRNVRMEYLLRGLCWLWALFPLSWLPVGKHKLLQRSFLIQFWMLLFEYLVSHNNFITHSSF